MIPMYNTKIFTDIWDNQTDFLRDVKASGLNLLQDSSLNVLFSLLYANYGNSPIANLDENQFKYKVYSIIYSYGPTWEKRLEIQSKLRALNDEEIVTGTKSINNHAYNPSSEPSTSTLQEVLEINEQNSQLIKKNKIDAYAMLWDMLATDVTVEFINRFKICFKQFVMPEHTVLYESED